MLAREDADTATLLAATGDKRRKGAPGAAGAAHGTTSPNLPSGELADLIEQLSEQMRAAAAELQFEVAARLRDEIGDLKKELRSMQAAGAG